MFDLDGTLVDSAPDIHAALNDTLAYFQLPQVELKQTVSWIGNGAPKLVERALSFVRENDTSDVTFPSVLQRFFQDYATYSGTRAVLYKGVIDGLQWLQSKHVCLTLCTNKPEQFTKTLLRTLSLQDYFSALVCGDTLSVKKPDPQPLLWLCDRVGVPPAESLMVGDSITDVEAARRAKMQIACMSYGYNHGRPIAQEFEGVVFDSMVELTDWLQQQRLIA